MLSVVILGHRYLDALQDRAIAVVLALIGRAGSVGTGWDSSSTWSPAVAEPRLACSQVAATRLRHAGDRGLGTPRWTGKRAMGALAVGTERAHSRLRIRTLAHAASRAHTAPSQGTRRAARGRTEHPTDLAADAIGRPRIGGPVDQAREARAAGLTSSGQSSSAADPSLGAAHVTTVGHPRSPPPRS
jgi:hypothetical protein